MGSNDLKKCRVTFLTVGHSPRADIMTDLGNHLSADIEVRQVGALDHLSVEQVHEELAPVGDEATMVSRLRNGEMCSFSKEKVMPLVQAAIDREGENGADAIVILCTNRFDPLTSKVPLLIPYNLIHSLTAVVGAGMKIGALFPFESHALPMAENWKETGFDVVYQCRSAAETAPIDQAVAYYKEQGCQMLVMDCIGYDFALREQFQQALNVPIIHPRTLIADLLQNLFQLNPVK